MTSINPLGSYVGGRSLAQGGFDERTPARSHGKHPQLTDLRGFR
jgi:hypothetical protein